MLIRNITDKDMTDTQISMFPPLTNLTGEDAWKVAIQVSTGELTYEKAKMMVSNVQELEDDLSYIDGLVNSCTY